MNSTQGRGKIPRPSNCFFQYRAAKLKELRDEAAALGLKRPSQSELSKIIGRMWREAHPNEKDFYVDKAAQEKEAHKKAYPDYHYRPRKRARQAEEDARQTDHDRQPPFVSSQTSTASIPCPGIGATPGLVLGPSPNADIKPRVHPSTQLSSRRGGRANQVRVEPQESAPVSKRRKEISEAPFLPGQPWVFHASRAGLEPLDVHIPMPPLLPYGGQLGWQPTGSVAPPQAPHVAITPLPPSQHKSLLDELYDPRLSYWETACAPLNAGFCEFASFGLGGTNGVPDASSPNPPDLTDSASSPESVSDGWGSQTFTLPTPSPPSSGSASVLSSGDDISSVDFMRFFNADNYATVPGSASLAYQDMAQPFLFSPKVEPGQTQHLRDPFHALPPNAVWPKHLGI
ncbi:hypothetical protein DICSQDRAFT_181897 [Dichomitus squalens LYAD-421 SS1]|uniref:HMG box domain-containing protein n=1 Tax=Dichomitus squalens (strain LYAD-421) TaxID=732165 RepID=R7SUG1_DICSQ|nr:uncharacterized protein DICSQDRAFT_181897 [Dichomitus squalens LYAD-421 SS1]EJF59558.1 hypothetical protein DICSQDRAFT_181897 [Dichomitus squalens LYAD-421 SS1]